MLRKHSNDFLKKFLYVFLITAWRYSLYLDCATGFPGLFFLTLFSVWEIGETTVLSNASTNLNGGLLVSFTVCSISPSISVSSCILLLFSSEVFCGD